MGGTMDYPRFRNRNRDLIGYRVPIDEKDPYNIEWSDLLSNEEKGRLRMPNGDLNRMEKDILGLNSSMTDREINFCRDATGVDVESARRVLRWFLGYPEPYCVKCMTEMDHSQQATHWIGMDGKPHVGPSNTRWRCAEHSYGPNWGKIKE